MPSSDLLLEIDWSARDIQSYEMMPLGPFQGKNFATTVSPWVISPDALKPFEIPLPERLVPELVYLQDERVNRALDINLSVEVQIGSEFGMMMSGRWFQPGPGVQLMFGSSRRKPGYRR